MSLSMLAVAGLGLSGLADQTATFMGANDGAGVSSLTNKTAWSDSANWTAGVTDSTVGYRTGVWQPDPNTDYRVEKSLTIRPPRFNDYRFIGKSLTLGSATATTAFGVGTSVQDADFTCSDPFVVRDDAAGVYRLYHNAPVRGAADPLVMMRTSKDLVDWSAPVGVLTLPKDFNCNSLWAPEVHPWKGKWYLFGTVHKPVDPKNLLPVTVPDFKPQRRKSYLATWTFVADTPEGPFRPFADKAITPEDWSSLDGTLFEQDGKPYMVFCHEWTQVRDGTMEAVELASDLSSAVGKPFTLFKASDLRAAVEGQPMKVPHGVTDGPFLYRTKTGKLLMLWSSAFRGYLQAVSRSESGRLEGPWTHHELIREKDSGHGMVFTTFDGRLALALHSPNSPHVNKRLRIFELEDTGDSLRVGRQIGGCFADVCGFRVVPGEPIPRVIIWGKDASASLRRAQDEIVRELRRVTSVTAEKRNYAGTAMAGDIFLTTQPWDAPGAWKAKLEHGVVEIHGADDAATVAAARAFVDEFLSREPTGKRMWEIADFVRTHGPQYEDVKDAMISKVDAVRRAAQAPEWENELVTEVNRARARAYSIPLASEEEAFAEDMPKTPFVKSLNGQWRYRWSGRPSDRPKEFWRLDYDDSDWNDIDVPSCVEMKGFGLPIYTNTRYPHPTTPPKLDPDYNPVSSYRTAFAVPESWRGRDVYLRFDGVLSGFYLWVNGRRVGYSEDSFLPAEFNVTPYLRDGKNLLCVEVYRWSGTSM